MFTPGMGTLSASTTVPVSVEPSCANTVMLTSNTTINVNFVFKFIITSIKLELKIVPAVEQYHADTGCFSMASVD
jgi:hypothetical protein